MSFHLKKQNKTEWLVGQNHTLRGVIWASTERMDTFHQECCLKGC